MARLKCPRCATMVEVAPGQQPVCPTCGFGDAGRRPTAPSAPPPRAAPAPHVMAHGPPPSYATPAAPAPIPSGPERPAAWSGPQGIGQVFVRVVTLFGVVGVALGVATLLMVAVTGGFSDGAGDLGTAVVGLLFVTFGLAFAYFGSVFLAVAGAGYAIRTLAKKGEAMVASAAGAGVGHVVMGLASILVVMVGFMLFLPEQADGTETEDATMADLETLLMFLAGALPAAAVGALVPLLWAAPRSRDDDDPFR